MDDDGDKDDDSDSETNKRKKELEEEERRMKQQREEAAKKAKEEELWASFQKDTAFKPSSKPTSSKTVRCDGDLCYSWKLHVSAVVLLSLKTLLQVKEKKV